MAELTENDLLEHEVINQLEADFDSQDYDAMSELLQLLMKDDKSKGILIEYLGDSAKENWVEGKTKTRY